MILRDTDTDVSSKSFLQLRYSNIFKKHIGSLTGKKFGQFAESMS